MSPELADICDALDISVIDVTKHRKVMQTHAGETMQRLLDAHGAGHLTIVLRSIVESENNKLELVAPMIWAMSDLILAHPTWPETGLAWLEALDAVDLAGIREIAKANQRAAQPRAGIATMLFLHLREIFAAEPQERLI